jgi:CRISPR-associated endonuclease/helicase Cas3
VYLADSKKEFDKAAGFVIDLSLAAAGLNPKTGMGWTERVLKLLQIHGPFALAWMEAMFRAADQRASRLSVKDQLLHPEEKP